MIDDIYTDPDSIFALYQYGLTLFVENADDVEKGVTTGASVTGSGQGASTPPLLQFTPIGVESGGFTIRKADPELT